MIHLTSTMKKLILHWGEMGTRWGINRTMAQIHALLYLSPAPLHAEEMAATLSVARSNVSNSLRELQNWGIVKVTHVLGDRRDHFESMKDVWEMFRIVLAERKKRELDPTLAMLRECLAEAQKERHPDKHTQERLTEFLHFFETMSSCYEQLRQVPTPALIQMIKTSDKVRKLLGLAAK